MKTITKYILFSLMLLSLSSCEIFALIETSSPMIVESKVASDRYRVRYNNNENFLEIVTTDSLCVGDTLRIAK